MKTKIIDNVIFLNEDTFYISPSYIERYKNICIDDIQLLILDDKYEVSLDSILDSDDDLDIVKDDVSLLVKYIMFDNDNDSINVKEMTEDLLKDDNLVKLEAIVDDINNEEFKLIIVHT